MDKEEFLVDVAMEVRKMLDRIARDGAYKAEDLNYIVGLYDRGEETARAEIRYALGIVE